MKCIICGNDTGYTQFLGNTILDNPHAWYCKFCDHKWFTTDKNYGELYADHVEHIDEPTKSMWSSQYWINGTRMMLLGLQKLFVFNVLEVGPGYPGLFYDFKEQYPESTYYFKETNKKASDKLIQAGARKYRDDIKYDVVLLCNVLYYMEDPVLELKLLREKMRGNGKILIDIINPAVLPDEYWENNTMIQVFSKHSLERALDKAGFSVVYCGYEGSQELFEVIKKPNIFDRLLNKFGLITQDRVKQLSKLHLDGIGSSCCCKYIKAIASQSF